MDRKNRWQWWNAILMIVFLLAAMATLFLARLWRVGDSSLLFRQTPYVQALLLLMLAFNVYTLYQQHALKLLRNQTRVRTDNVYELAVLDPLTGLYNRRFVEDRLRTEITRVERHGDPLMVLVLDLDDFKKINDHFGHAAGDLVLKEVAHRIRKAIRASDFAVRMGGDECLVLLPECSPENVKLVLSRLAPFNLDCGGEKIVVSMSTGYSQYQTGDTIEQLVGRADEALYAAKADRRVRGLELHQAASNESTALRST
jgi:diguanylate cyclase (GGDEF)-like protein